MASVTTIESGDTAGIWVSTDNGKQVGLVAQDGLGAYLCLFPKPESNALPFAIAACDGTSHVTIQVPDADGEVKVAKVVRLSRLLAALESAD